MVNMECLSPYLKILEPERPVFELVKTIPEGIPQQLEKAVEDFIKTSHVPSGVDLAGVYQQTLLSIVARSAMNQPGSDLWLGISNNDLWTYILSHMGPDIDGRMAYTVTQAWVRQDQRGKPWVKWAWEKVRQRAKDCFASHFVVMSTRGNDKAYCRFLGKGFHPYSSILKEEL